MNWNYRIISKDEGFAIHEVYYDTDGKPTTCTVQAVAPYGDTWDELLEDMGKYMEALGRPVLQYDKIEWNGA